MAKLTCGSGLVAHEAAIASRGQVHETPGQLSIRRGLRKPRRASERPGCVRIVARSQPRRSDVERTLEEIGLADLARVAYGHEKPGVSGGGGSGLRGRPARGSGALYPAGATSFGDDG